MITTLLITDLTRMRDGKVCLAGYDPAGKCIRPVFERWRIPEEWLWVNHNPAILPFERVELKLIEPRPAAPHVEDWTVDEDYRVPRGRIPETERGEFLAKHRFGSVEALFGTRVYHDYGCYIQACGGCRSLGTVKVGRLCSLTYELRELDGRERWDFRVNFVDESGQEFSLPVTDLSYRYYLEHLRAVQKRSTIEITTSLARFFGTVPVYLRLGLTRPGWEKSPDTSHIQINGIYSFPDYLRGKTFADYTPEPSSEPVGW